MPISVDQATLNAAATDVATTREEIDGDLRRLRGVIDELAGAWGGGAAVSFQNLMVRWQEDTTKLLGALSGIGDLLQRSGAQHAATDEAEMQQMNNIAGALNP